MTINLKLSALLTGMLLSISVARTDAAIITYNQTVDLTGLIVHNGIAGEYIDTQFHAAPDYVINVGDTLVINYSFLPGQRLRLTNSQGDSDERLHGWALQLAGCHTFSGSGSASFVDPAGTGSMVSHTEGSGCAHVGLTYLSGNGTLALAAGDYIEFSGLDFSMVLDSSSAPNLLLTAPWLLLSADDIAVSITAPEPASTALLGIGLVAAGCRRWRRRCKGLAF